MKKILILEDNREICELIEMILADKYDVAFRTSIDEVLKMDISEYSLVIIDFLIGTRNAGVVIDKFPKYKYLIVTALSIQNPNVGKIVNYKNIFYLQKPFDLEEFQTLVDKIISENL